jgi:serine/threonine protein kinase
MTLEEVTARVKAAACPEDVFGAEPAGIGEAFRMLAKAAHPDHQHTPARLKLATETFAALTSRKREADHKVADGTYGDRKSPVAPRKTVIRVAGDQLELGALLRAGDIADVYAGQLLKRGQQVAVKIARSSKDNDLIRAERDILAKLDAIEPKGRRYFAEGTKLALDVTGRAGNVLIRYPEHVPLDRIKARASLGFRDMVWMLRRLFEGLGYLHRAGVVHGNLTPPNLLFHPVEHGLRIIDWCYAVPNSKPGKAKSAGWEYPPELSLKQPLTPATDIWQACWSARWMLGDDAWRLMPRPVCRFLDGCLIVNPAHRPNDAWSLHEELGELLQRLVGPPKYHHLDLKDGESHT